MREQYVIERRKVMTNVFEEERVVVLEDQVTGEKNIVWEDLTEEEARQEAHRLNEEKREECYYYASNYIIFANMGELPRLR